MDADLTGNVFLTTKSPPLSTTLGRTKATLDRDNTLHKHLFRDLRSVIRRGAIQHSGGASWCFISSGVGDTTCQLQFGRSIGLMVLTLSAHRYGMKLKVYVARLFLEKSASINSPITPNSVSFSKS